MRVQIREAYTASTRISCSIRNFAVVSSRIRRERTLGRGERHDDVNLGPSRGCGGNGNQRQDASSFRPTLSYATPTKHIDKEMIDG